MRHMGSHDAYGREVLRAAVAAKIPARSRSRFGDNSTVDHPTGRARVTSRHPGSSVAARRSNRPSAARGTLRR
jgi:hypothetical protein